jgi:hypothetical protein
MFRPETLKTLVEYLKSVWGAIGPLVGALAGVLVGAWLARSWDKQKWMKDSRKQECQELLAAITEAATTILKSNMVGGVSLQQRNDVYYASLKVFQSRLFIARDVEKYKLFDAWVLAVNEFNGDGDRHKFDDTFDKIRDRIVQMATI